METTPATDTTKDAFAASVKHLLGETTLSVPILTKKYLTGDNKFAYVTHCTIPDPHVPQFKVQLFERVEGGVMEFGYQLFADQRFVRTTNPMIFNTADDEPAAPQDVSENETQVVLQILAALGPDNEKV